jgi:hypothetical protein
LNAFFNGTQTTEVNHTEEMYMKHTVGTQWLALENSAEEEIQASPIESGPSAQKTKPNQSSNNNKTPSIFTLYLFIYCYVESCAC